MTGRPPHPDCPCLLEDAGLPFYVLMLVVLLIGALLLCGGLL